MRTDSTESMRRLDAFRPALTAALDNALSYLDRVDESPVAATVDLATLRSRLNKPLSDAGADAAVVVEQLVADVDGGILGSAGGRFFSWVIGGSLPAALAADWLTSTWDQNAALYACGPAAAVVEEVAGAWLAEILGLPDTASFAFVTGCQMAHVTCLAAARHALLSARGYDVEERGLAGAPRIRVFAGASRHGSVERAVRLLGLGTSALHEIASNDDEQMDSAALEAALAQDPAAPTVVVLQAGTINTGSFDAFETVVPLARKYGAWVHVDGAFGLWVAANAKYRHLVNGVAAADSWATDGHKLLNVPFDCGYAFVRDADAHSESMSHRAVYLVHDLSARDQIDWNPEWSRRARGFSTYAAIRQLGRAGIAAMIENCCVRAQQLVAGLAELEGVEVLWAPVIDQGLVRFLSPASGATDEDHDAWTDRIIVEILASGAAHFGGTTWRGRRAMRISVVNWSTSQEDVDRSVRAVHEVLRAGRSAGVSSEKRATV